MEFLKNSAFQENAVGTSFRWILSFSKLIFQSVPSKLVEEFEGTIWTLSKKGRGPNPLDPSPRCAPNLIIFFSTYYSPQ